MTAQSFTHTSIHTSHRPLNGQQDAMRVRQLLIDSYTRMGREFNWETRRWEGWYWTVTDAERDTPMRGSQAHIWETAEGQILGAAVPEEPGDLSILIHPDYRALEEDILTWAEDHLAVTHETGQRQLRTWAFDWDTDRQDRLRRHGFVANSSDCFQHRRRLVSDPIDDVPLPEGYSLRSITATNEDVEGWVTCTNATFGQTYLPEMHRNFQVDSPSHNYDLHIVAVAPDGTFAAFAGLTVDDINRTATFEPVGTHPDHRRKGLARAAMYEGIRRLQALGSADVVYVANWGTAEAGQFYAAIGMAHYATLTAWDKIF